MRQQAQRLRLFLVIGGIIMARVAWSGPLKDVEFATITAMAAQEPGQPGSEGQPQGKADGRRARQEDNGQGAQGINTNPEQFGAIGYLVRNADPLNALVVLLAFYLIQPLLSRIPFFAADRNRMLIVAILLGFPLGYLAEFSSRGVQIWIVVRRGLAAGCTAASAAWFARVFFHAADSSYVADPAPPQRMGTMEVKPV